MKPRGDARGDAPGEKVKSSWKPAFTTERTRALSSDADSRGHELREILVQDFLRDVLRGAEVAHGVELRGRRRRYRHEHVFLRARGIAEEDVVARPFDLDPVLRAEELVPVDGIVERAEACDAGMGRKARGTARSASDTAVGGSDRSTDRSIDRRRLLPIRPRSRGARRSLRTFPISTRSSHRLAARRGEASDDDDARGTAAAAAATATTAKDR